MLIGEDDCSGLSLINTNSADNCQLCLNQITPLIVGMGHCIMMLLEDSSACGGGGTVETVIEDSSMADKLLTVDKQLAPD